MFFEVLPTEIYRADGGALTYSSKINLLPGQLVLIPIGPKTVAGIVLRRVKNVDFPTRPISRILYHIPIPKHLVKSAYWLSDYYLAPLTACASLLIPAGLTARGALKTPDYTPPSTLKLPLIELNPHQQTALKSLQEASGGTSLLRGVTGSGKTNIYLKMAADTLKTQKSVILLVPEIALTSQLVKIFEQTFGNRVVLIHSEQTMAERRQTWLKILNSTATSTSTPAENPPHTPEPLIVIGPRSALFAPLANLGLILIDESHESAYFQENPPRYSALRLASFMAKTLDISCIFGSATPNLVDYHLSKTKKSLVDLNQKAKNTAITPNISVVDLKNRPAFSKNRYFSNILLTNIEHNIQDKHQTLIFHNRRGSAPITICENCGWQALCPNCFLPMTLHTDSYTLCCHICGHEEKVPKSCPECHHASILHKGFGTKLLESELSRLFPDAKIARFDGDNKKDGSLAALYDEVKSGEINILIGTQTLARGLDLPHLATVGIVQADAGLALPDFAAEERTFELLTQVIGRVGRGHLDVANVVLQTFQPDHPVIKTALTADFPAFADYLLKKRRGQHLPPFSHLARLSITYKTEKTTLAKIRQAHTLLSQNPQLSLSPPMPAFHERTNRGWTWQITIKATSRAHLISALRPFAFSKYSIVLDPPSLL